eukprot:scaffold3281_cov286-Prasinococcus_capsulatus_cf.AAC.2
MKFLAKIRSVAALMAGNSHPSVYARLLALPSQVGVGRDPWRPQQAFKATYGKSNERVRAAHTSTVVKSAPLSSELVSPSSAAVAGATGSRCEVRICCRFCSCSWLYLTTKNHTPTAKTPNPAPNEASVAASACAWQASSKHTGATAATCTVARPLCAEPLCLQLRPEVRQ